MNRHRQPPDYFSKPQLYLSLLNSDLTKEMKDLHWIWQKNIPYPEDHFFPKTQSQMHGRKSTLRMVICPTNDQVPKTLGLDVFGVVISTLNRARMLALSTFYPDNLYKQICEVTVLSRNINRRQFIKSVLLTSGAVALASKVGVKNAHALENVSVIVVGAGIAGLGAAHMLRKHGAKSHCAGGKRPYRWASFDRLVDGRAV